MTLQELVQKALQAEGEGIPVDWRTLTQHVLRNAQQGVAELEADLLKMQSWSEDVCSFYEEITEGDGLDDDVEQWLTDKEKEPEEAPED